MNGCTFRGSHSVIFMVASHINWDQLLTERICSYRSKFFPVRVDPVLGILRHPGGLVLQQCSHYLLRFPVLGCIS